MLAKSIALTAGAILLVAAIVLAARFGLRLGAILMPLGFLFAGIWHYESDPGLAIWLVPAGALLLIFGVVSFALASWTNWRESN